MSHFPDTSFLYALYRPRVSSKRADKWMATLEGSLRVSSLLLLEFRQSVRFQVRIHAEEKTKGFSQTEGSEMLRDMQEDLSSGLLTQIPVDWSAVHHRADGLSSRYTTSSGHRLIDILHVATALELGAREFLTFDQNQSRLAQAEGMTIPF